MVMLWSIFYSMEARNEANFINFTFLSVRSQKRVFQQSKMLFNNDLYKLFIYIAVTVCSRRNTVNEETKFVNRK